MRVTREILRLKFDLGRSHREIALADKLVEVYIRPRIIQIFYQSRTVACHRRSSNYGHTTKPEHMPSHHRHQVEWTRERFQSWAFRSGPSVRDFVTELLKRRRHPEQAFRSCFGLMRLADQFSSERLNAACLKAFTLGLFEYKSVKNILGKGLDSMPLLDESSPPPTAGSRDFQRVGVGGSHFHLSEATEGVEARPSSHSSGRRGGEAPAERFVSRGGGFAVEVGGSDGAPLSDRGGSASLAPSSTPVGTEEVDKSP